MAPTRLPATADANYLTNRLCHKSFILQTIYLTNRLSNKPFVSHKSLISQTSIPQIIGCVSQKPSPAIPRSFPLPSG